MSRSRSPAAIFFWPALIGFACAVGVVAALVGDGPWDALSWALLAVPVAIGLRGCAR